MGRLFYAQALEHVVPVRSTQVAGMVKLLENTFRMINVGLVNEIAMMSDRIGINVWEVVDAAATKPFGFMPFYPGPGLGGHCIPLDPFYLSWKTKQAGIEARFIELGGYINGQMPHFVVDKIQNAPTTRESGEGLEDPRHGRGFTTRYRRRSGVSGARRDDALAAQGATVTYSDPHVPSLKLDGLLVHASPESAAGC